MCYYTENVWQNEITFNNVVLLLYVGHEGGKNNDIV